MTGPLSQFGLIVNCLVAYNLKPEVEGSMPNKTNKNIYCGLPPFPLRTLTHGIRGNFKFNCKLDK
jgi:hypothetical protein